jgi:glycosyltransferase involved in cell wall biosynthesis
MRLLFISNLYPPHDLGGHEQWCQETTLRLRKRGHEVCVLTSRHGTQSEAERQTTSDGVDGVIRSLYLQADLHYYRPGDFFLKRPLRERRNIETLRKTIGQFAPDLIVIWGMWNISLALAHWAERWLPGRVAYHMASYWPQDQDPDTTYWRLPARRPLAELVKKPLRAVALAELRRKRYPPPLQFEHVLCCSRFVRDALVRSGKLPPTAGVLYGGIDPEPFRHRAAETKHPPDRPLRLLYFGRLIRDKGVHTAIEAVGLLETRGLARHVELTILGSGHPDYEKHLRTMVADLKIGDRVRFVDRVPQHEIPSWLRSADVFVFPSIWPEPMGRTVMEAMAAGLLVIGSEVGGQVEMLADGQNALTFRPADAVGLADGVGRALREPDLRHRLARAGQATVLERFTLDRMVDDLEAYLQRVLAAASRARPTPAAGIATADPVPAP